MLPTFAQMLALFSLMLIGYVAGKLKILTLAENKTLSKIVNFITNPLLAVFVRVIATAGNRNTIQTVGS